MPESVSLGVGEMGGTCMSPAVFVVTVMLTPVPLVRSSLDDLVTPYLLLLLLGRWLGPRAMTLEGRLMSNSSDESKLLDSREPKVPPLLGDFSMSISSRSSKESCFLCEGSGRVMGGAEVGIVGGAEDGSEGGLEVGIAGGADSDYGANPYPVRQRDPDPAEHTDW